jgi:hypothetical protein
LLARLLPIGGPPSSGEITAIARASLESLNRFNAGIFQELVSSRKHKLCLFLARLREALFVSPAFAHFTCPKGQ